MHILTKVLLSISITVYHIVPEMLQEWESEEINGIFILKIKHINTPYQIITFGSEISECYLEA
jgi:hypothetical protein